MTSRKQLGMRIRYLREKKRYSQLDFANECGINRNYLCDLEAGRRNPTLDILERIATGFGISLEELFKGIENIPGI